eukprot:SAG22_NODE_9152_length_607_cov_0.988189_2_plen_121_part_00
MSIDIVRVMCDKQMIMVLASSWVQEQISRQIREHISTVKAYERLGDHTYRQIRPTGEHSYETVDMKLFLEALVEISDHIHKQKQLTDDIKKLKDIMSIFDYEHTGDDDDINKIKKIVDRY